MTGEKKKEIWRVVKFVLFSASAGIIQLGLFTLLNERMATGRHTVIATNLSPVQLKERYGERVASRLLDRSKGLLIQLEGKDLRLL